MEKGAIELKYSLHGIANNIYMIEESDVCVYIVIGTEGTAVIDTGYGSFNLREAVEKLTDKPFIVLCTHGHIDHVSGAGYFNKIYLNQNDVPIMKQYDENYKRGIKNRMQQRFGLSDEEIEQWCSLKFPDTIPLYPGMSFNLGGYSLEAIDLCGHTHGSIGFLCKEAGFLFSGDGVIERSWLHLSESASLTTYYKTICLLNDKKHEFSYIYTGHKNAHKPVAFLDELTSLLEHVIEEKDGTEIDTGIASGLLAGEPGCQIVYNPRNVR